VNPLPAPPPIIVLAQDKIFPIMYPLPADAIVTAVTIPAVTVIFAVALVPLPPVKTTAL